MDHTLPFILRAPPPPPPPHPFSPKQPNYPPRPPYPRLLTSSPPHRFSPNSLTNPPPAAAVLCCLFFRFWLSRVGRCSNRGGSSPTPPDLHLQLGRAAGRAVADRGEVAGGGVPRARRGRRCRCGRRGRGRWQRGCCPPRLRRGVRLGPRAAAYRRGQHESR